MLHCCSIKLCRAQVDVGRRELVLDFHRVGECAYVCEYFSVVVVREDFRYLIRVLVVVIGV